MEIYCTRHNWWKNLQRKTSGLGRPYESEKIVSKINNDDGDVPNESSDHLNKTFLKTNYSNFGAWSSNKFEIAALLSKSKTITNTLANKIVKKGGNFKFVGR